MLIFLCIIPATVYILKVIEKERMPHVRQSDTLMSIDWNDGISALENDRRTGLIVEELGDAVLTSTSMIGTQEFLLPHTKEITASEAVIYLQTHSEMELDEVKHRVTAMLRQHYPKASVQFGEPGNIYDLIFTTDEADLEIHLQDMDGRRPGVLAVRQFTDTLRARFPDITLMPVVTETNIQYVADTEQMAQYKVSYETLYSRMKELLSRNRIFDINDGAQSVPVVIGVGDKDSRRLMQGTVRNADGTEIPIAYLVHERAGEDFKYLQAGGSGEYYSIGLNASDRQVEQVMDFVQDYVRRPQSQFSLAMAGSYFSSRRLIAELTLVLSVALALLYFILAAQFESFIQPFIILLEMVVDVFFVVLSLWLLGETLNVMSMIGLIVMSGIIINDSILKVDTINRMRRGGMPLLKAIIEAGHSRLRPIVMTSLTTILALLPFLQRSDMGSALQYPLSLTLVIGMAAGTLVSIFFVPMLYYLIYRRHAHQ